MNYWKVLLFAFVVLSCNPVTERIGGFEVYGIDVSHYQSTINWDTVAVQNVAFAFMKATEGNTLIDSLFQYNWASGKRVNILRGAYHFFRPQVPVNEQVRHFISQVHLAPNDMAPVLDVEVVDGATPEELRDNVKLWLMQIEAHYKVKPIIYTNLNFYEEYLSSNFSDYPLWIARYSKHQPHLSYGKKWKFWQYGNRGQLRGIDGDVDFNVFRGNLSELLELCVPPKKLSAN